MNKIVRSNLTVRKLKEFRGNISMKNEIEQNIRLAL